jgi:type II secretory pathway component PulK
MSRRRSSERGVALLLAVSLVMLLVVLVGSLVISAGHSRAIADNALADLQAAYALRSAYAQALLTLQADAREGSGVDTLQEHWAKPWSIQLDRATVSVRIEDAERRLNLSRLVGAGGKADPVAVEQMRRLFSVLGQDPDGVDRIVDYIDADSIGPHEEGARNAPLYTLDELLRVKGFTPEMVYGQEGVERPAPLEPSLTVWPRERSGSGPPAVNINTADGPVLRALSERMTDAAVSEILGWRSGISNQGKPNAFASFGDVQREVRSLDEAALDQIKPYLVYKSGTFLIQATARVGNLTRAWVFVVRRDGAGRLPTLLAQYRKESLRPLPPPQP